MKVSLLKYVTNIIAEPKYKYRQQEQVTVKELFILFAASAFRKLSPIYVFNYFPFGFEGRIWDLIVSVPDHCLSFYLMQKCFNPTLNLETNS